MRSNCKIWLYNQFQEENYQTDKLDYIKIVHPRPLTHVEAVKWRRPMWRDISPSHTPFCCPGRLYFLPGLQSFREGGATGTLPTQPIAAVTTTTATQTGGPAPWCQRFHWRKPAVVDLWRHGGDVGMAVGVVWGVETVWRGGSEGCGPSTVDARDGEVVLQQRYPIVSRQQLLSAGELDREETGLKLQLTRKYLRF